MRAFYFSILFFIFFVNIAFGQQTIFNYSFENDLPKDLIYWSCNNTDCSEEKSDFSVVEEGQDVTLKGENHSFIRFDGNKISTGPYVPKSFSTRFRVNSGGIHVNFAESLGSKHVRHFLGFYVDNKVQLRRQDGQNFYDLKTLDYKVELGRWYLLDLSWDKSGKITAFVDGQKILEETSVDLILYADSSDVSLEVLPGSVTFFDSWNIVAEKGGERLVISSEDITPENLETVLEVEKAIGDKLENFDVPMPLRESCFQEAYQEQCLSAGKEIIPILENYSKDIPELKPFLLEVSSYVAARSIQDIFSSDSQTRSDAISVLVDVAPKVVTQVAKIAVEKTEEFIESPTGQVTVAVTQPVGIVSGSVAVGSQVVLSTVTVTSFTDIYLLVIRTAGLITGIFTKKRREWGTVYDSVTKRPLDPAYVVVKNDAGEEASDAITDLDGRYGFFLSPGKYLIEAQKTNYIFPSKKLSGQSQDILYDSLYFGEKIDTKEGEVITKNIPLDPVNFDWNEFQKDKQKLFRIYSRREKVWRFIFNILYMAGFSATFLSTVFNPGTANYIFLGVYILFVLYQYIFLPSKKAVSVRYDDGEPIAFAIVRAFSSKLSKEIKNVVTDKMGRFYLLVAPGEYYLTLEERQSDGSYKKIYTTESMNLKRGIIKSDIVVPK